MTLSSASYAKANAPSISPSMSIRTRAASRLQSNWLVVLSCTVPRHVAFSCLRDMIPTPSSFKEEAYTSSSLCWRLRSHEVPRHLEADFYGRTQSDSGGRAIHRQGGCVDQSLSGSRVCSPPFQQKSLYLRT